jgi:hypothetical protein
MPISKYYLSKATKFAEDQMETSKSLYKYRGEQNESKIKQDIIIGKLGEIAVYQYLKEKEYEANRPDFTIYNRVNKSFAADINCGSYDIHVKSQGVESARRYGNSWLLQRSDKLIKSPHKDEFLAFTNVDLDSMSVNILGIIRAKDIIDYNLLDECRVPRYRHTKVALYWEHIQEILQGHRRWRL